MEPEGFPLMKVKPAPAKVAAEMSTVDVPTFVTVTLCTAVLPIATLPKLTVAELTERTPVLGVFGWAAALVKPAQLENPTIARIVASIERKTNGPDEWLSVTPFRDVGDWIRCARVCARNLISRTV